MALPPDLQAVYGRYWSLAQDFGGAKDETGAYSVQSPDFVSAVAQLAREAGQALSFAVYSFLPKMFGWARSASNAQTSLNSADLTASIDSSMLSQWPTAASLTTQAAQPQYMARAQISYTDMLGQAQTRWITLSGITQLPDTVGGLALRVQGAAITAYTAPVSEGGTPKASGEVMAEFGQVLTMQLFTV